MKKIDFSEELGNAKFTLSLRRIFILDPLKNPKSDALAKVVHNYKLPDFILRYEYDRKEDDDGVENENDEEDDEDNKKKRIDRKNFEILLLRSGLILEREFDADKKYTYIKIIAPFEVLCEQAQQIKLKMQVNVSEKLLHI